MKALCASHRSLPRNGSSGNGVRETLRFFPKELFYPGIQSRFWRVFSSAHWVFMPKKKEETFGSRRNEFPDSAALGVESSAWRVLNSKRFPDFPIHLETNVTLGYVRAELPE